MKVRESGLFFLKWPQKAIPDPFISVYNEEETETLFISQVN